MIENLGAKFDVYIQQHASVSPNLLDLLFRLFPLSTTALRFPSLTGLVDIQTKSNNYKIDHLIKSLTRSRWLSR